MSFYECSPTRLMFMFQFVLPNEDTRKSDCYSLSSWCMLWTTELFQININEPGETLMSRQHTLSSGKADHQEQINITSSPKI